MRTIGQAVCSAIVVTVLTSIVVTKSGRTAPTLGAYQTVFVIAGLAALVAVGLTLLIPARRSTSVREPALVEAGGTP